MSNYVRSAAYAASQALAAQGLKVKRSHISEVAAALLGYRTYAALAVEEAVASHGCHLDDAEIYVLNVPLGTLRSTELGLHGTVAPLIVSACIRALKGSSAQADAYESVDDFYESHAREALAQAIYDSDDVAGTMAESNASFPDAPEMEDACPATSDLWATRDEWTLEADGVLAGEYDPEGDRMFNGDTLNCRGWMTYCKAGRAGLVFAEAGGSCNADDSWHDHGYEDEMVGAKSP